VRGSEALAEVITVACLGRVVQKEGLVELEVKKASRGVEAAGDVVVMVAMAVKQEGEVAIVVATEDLGAALVGLAATLVMEVVIEVVIEVEAACWVVLVAVLVARVVLVAKVLRVARVHRLLLQTSGVLMLSYQ
jgi:hypothetical protein